MPPCQPLQASCWCQHALGPMCICVCLGVASSLQVGDTEVSQLLHAQAYVTEKDKHVGLCAQGLGPRRQEAAIAQR